MNLTNLLDYSNSIYSLNKKINSVERKNEKACTKASTVIKMLLTGIMTDNDSLNGIQYSIFEGRNKIKNSLFSKKEYIPKMHGIRDCVNDIDENDIINVHKEIINKMKRNKVFENKDYRNTKVAILDGVESFETHKNIEGLHKRNHSDGTVGYYYKSLGISYLTDDFSIILDLVPFKTHEVRDDNNNSNKIKSEGEITVLKRTIPTLKEFNIEMVVLDAMFLNAPCLNKIKDNGMDAVVRMKDDRRTIYQDAHLLFETMKPNMEYEVVEVKERKRVKYSKESKKKNSDETDTYQITRSITSNELNGAKLISDKTVIHPKKEVRKTKHERVIKRVKIYTDIFELPGYKYNNGNVRIIKTIENTKNGENIMYLLSTKINEDLEFIVDLMHKRWTIELNCFRTLKSRYHLKHLYIGTNKAIQIISYLMIIVFNLIELYYNIHTKKYKRKINFKQLLKNYRYDLESSENIYLLFVT